MNRLPPAAVLLTGALGILLPVAPAPAQADPIGGLTIIPGTGTDLDPLRLRTSSGCPAQASAYYATMRGHGLPPDGQIITTNTEAGLSHTIGFDVYVALIMRDYAGKNRTTLAGRYDITVYCTDGLGLESYGEFTGSLEFTGPNTYQAIGAAKPVGPPPPPLALDGSALALDRGSPPIGQAPALGQPAPSPAGHPSIGQAPSTDSQVTSGARQRASQPNNVSVGGVPWLVLVLLVLVAVAVTAVARQIRKRRSL